MKVQKYLLNFLWFCVLSQIFNVLWESCNSFGNLSIRFFVWFVLVENILCSWRDFIQLWYTVVVYSYCYLLFRNEESLLQVIHRKGFSYSALHLQENKLNVCVQSLRCSVTYTAEVCFLQYAMTMFILPINFYQTIPAIFGFTFWMWVYTPVIIGPHWKE